jgi:hypothetical protein
MAKAKTRAKGAKTITLYLSSWQKRMVIDQIGTSAAKRKQLTRVTAVTIPFVDRRQWVMYRQPVQSIETGEWNLYLTDEQIAMVADVVGVSAKISALNVSSEKIESGAIVFG